MLLRGRGVLCFGGLRWGLCCGLEYVMVRCCIMLWFCISPLFNPPKRRDKNSFEVKVFDVGYGRDWYCNKDFVLFI